MRPARRRRCRTTGVYTMRRPDRFYTKTTGGRGLEAWYNGKTLTIAMHADKVFAQAPMPETIDRTLDALAERYDMPLPMGDLFYGSAEKALLSDTTTGGYAGTEDVGGTPVPSTSRSRTSASTGNCGCRRRASRCRNG